MKQKTIGDFTDTISVCQKNRKSTWANGQPRNTTKGMKMVVDVTGKGSKRKSVTSFQY